MKIAWLGKRRKSGLIGIFIAIATFSFIHYLGNKEKRLVKNKKMTVANCLSVHFSKVNGYGLFYNFQVEGKMFKGEKTLGYNDERIQFGKSLINKNCLLIYDSTDYDNNSLLLTNEDYIKYSVETKNCIDLSNQPTVKKEQ